MALRLINLKILNFITRFSKVGTVRSNITFNTGCVFRKNSLVYGSLIKQGISYSFTNHQQCSFLSTGIQASGRIYIEFTCKKCNTRNKKFMSKVAYKSGVVIIECEGCKNNHLIADNLNWFTDLNGKKNVEDILREKGESVQKLLFTEEGVSEIVEETKALK